MSNKTHCPGCDSYTSSLTTAFEEGWPCPQCGLSNDAWVELNTIHAARNDDELSRKYREVRVENDKLRRELNDVRRDLTRIQRAVTDVGWSR